MVISARARILGWMLVLVALAVGASIAVARSILIARLDERLDRVTRGFRRSGRARRRGGELSVITPLTTGPHSCGPLCGQGGTA
jgi:hypothetical protein